MNCEQRVQDENRAECTVAAYIQRYLFLFRSPNCKIWKHISFVLASCLLDKTPDVRPVITSAELYSHSSAIVRVAPRSFVFMFVCAPRGA